MVSSDDRPIPARFSTDDLPERDRAEVFREVYARAIIRHDVEPLPDHPLRFSASFRMLPGLVIAAGSCSALHAAHGLEHIESDDLVLNVSVTGGRVVRQRGREALVRTGEAIVASAADAGTVTVLDTSRFISLRLQQRVMADLLDDVDAALVRTIPSSDALRLLIGYVTAIGERDSVVPVSLDRLVAAHVRDLAALTLTATRDAAVLARGRGLRAARLHAIKADVETNLGQSDLTVDAIAARHGISPRYVRVLFATEDMSFTSFVLERRLARVRRALTDPRLANRAISSIAFETGFSDLSYFNRTFRRRYGATPSDVRMAARRGED